jgi:hypothetical protein
VFEGEFKDGLKCGYGVYRYTNGTIYRGEYNNGVKHGNGTLIYPEGDTYEGCGRWFELGLFCGLINKFCDVASS